MPLVQPFSGVAGLCAIKAEVVRRVDVLIHRLRKREFTACGKVGWLAVHCVGSEGGRFNKLQEVGSLLMGGGGGSGGQGARGCSPMGLPAKSGGGVT